VGFQCNMSLWCLRCWPLLTIYQLQCVSHNIAAPNIVLVLVTFLNSIMHGCIYQLSCKAFALSAVQGRGNIVNVRDFQEQRENFMASVS
jgi:hypothetical protein